MEAFFVFNGMLLFKNYERMFFFERKMMLR